MTENKAAGKKRKVEFDPQTVEQKEGPFVVDVYTDTVDMVGKLARVALRESFWYGNGGKYSELFEGHATFDREDVSVTIEGTRFKLTMLEVTNPVTEDKVDKGDDNDEDEGEEEEEEEEEEEDEDDSSSSSSSSEDDEEEEEEEEYNIQLEKAMDTVLDIIDEALLPYQKHGGRKLFTKARVARTKGSSFSGRQFFIDGCTYSLVLSRCGSGTMPDKPYAIKPLREYHEQSLANIWHALKQIVREAMWKRNEEDEWIVWDPDSLSFHLVGWNYRLELLGHPCFK